MITVSSEYQEAIDEYKKGTPLPVPKIDLVGDKTLDQILAQNDAAARMISNMRRPWIDNSTGRLSSEVRQYVAKLEKQIADLQLEKMKFWMTRCHICHALLSEEGSINCSAKHGHSKT